MSGSDGNGAEEFLRDWHDSRMDLTDKVAVVTGGARGIGRAACMALAKDGIKAVAVVDQLDTVKEFTDRANEHFVRDVMVPFSGNVISSEFRRQVFTEMNKNHGVVSICVPAAGITLDRLAVVVDRETGEADLYSEEDFRRVLEVDLIAPIYWAMETVASVARDRHARGLKRWNPSDSMSGCIILVGSVSSAGNRGQISYATAKAGLEGAQATLATEAMYHGVRCAIIHPGYTDTAMVKALGEGFITEQVLPHTQLGRLIMPEEIADAICFMIRNASVSGELWADAGWHPSPR